LRGQLHGVSYAKILSLIVGMGEELVEAANRVVADTVITLETRTQYFRCIVVIESNAAGVFCDAREAC
jgi:hypothetical protein